jgi:hypothetical protein
VKELAWFQASATSSITGVRINALIFETELEHITRLWAMQSRFWGHNLNFMNHLHSKIHLIVLACSLACSTAIITRACTRATMF